MKEKVLFIIFTLAFFASIQFNFFKSIPQDKFEYSILESSETLVIGKLLNSENGNILDDGGFTGVYLYESDLKTTVLRRKNSYIKYINNETPSKVSYIPYRSQAGGQAIIYSIFDKTFNLDNKINILVFRMFNSISLSILLSLFLIWIYRKHGITVTIISFLLILSQYWIILYGKSSWWCNWVLFLPFVYGLLYFENRKKNNLNSYIPIFSLLFFIKFWFNGFEFISVFLISSSIPYILYLFENKLYFYLNFLKRHIAIFLISLTAILSFQLYQFYLLTGSLETGISYLLNAFSRRSSGQYVYTNELAWLNNLKQFHLDIILRYLGGSTVNPYFLKIPFIILVIIGFLSSLFLYRKKTEKKLIFVTWFSILAPFSWFLIFREHAHIHTHIDFIVWYCPFFLLLFIIISLALKSLLKLK